MSGGVALKALGLSFGLPLAFLGTAAVAAARPAPAPGGQLGGLREAGAAAGLAPRPRLGLRAARRSRASRRSPSARPGARAAGSHNTIIDDNDLRNDDSR